MTKTSDPGGLLSPILALSALLRVALVLSGGQNYWPDEDDANPRQILAALVRHDWREAFVRLDSADHPLFKMIALGPAAVERLIWSDPRVYALFVAAFSVVNIWLLARIARRLGAGVVESTAAAGCLAFSSAFFYWARHIQPYDASVTCALLALYVGVDPERTVVRRLSFCGVMCGCSFLMYAGAWAMTAGVVTISVALAARRWRDVPRAAAAAASGAAMVVGAALAVSAAFGGQLADSFLTRSATITQGSFAEGWRLPFEYLWHAEHTMILVWLASTVWWLARPRSAAASPRVRAALLGLAVVYACLALSSVVLHVFVVYGRMARQLVPFFCLLAGVTFATLAESPRRLVRQMAAAGATLMALQAAANFRQPLVQSFPSDFIARNTPDVQTTSRYERLIWINTRHLRPMPDHVDLASPYVTLAEAAHPLEFRPYQYEGFTPAERAALRSADISMRLLGVPVQGRRGT